jgi:hypothetical protein
MAISDRYSSRYPRQGDFAILCEGDIAGLEVDLLEKWTAMKSKHLVDLWPCGKRSSIMGVADAIGRSRPLAVIEDRDYRSPDKAAQDCQRSYRDRVEKRGLQLKYWRAWHRHEIENYLIEPDVLVPVLSERFTIPEEKVRERLATLVSQLGADQAAQSVISEMSDRLSSNHPDRYIAGLPRKTARPRLDQESNSVLAPDAAEPRRALESLISEKVGLISSDVKGFSDLPKALLDKYDALVSEWSSVTFDSAVWRIDWAGKDMLVHLCRWLSFDPGWIQNADSGQVRIDWERLEAEDKGLSARAKEREIITELQPQLVRSFLRMLENPKVTEIGNEWLKLVNDLAIKA